MISTSATIFLDSIIKEFNLELTNNQERQIKKLAIAKANELINNGENAEKLQIKLSPTENHICNMVVEKLLRKYYD